MSDVLAMTGGGTILIVAGEEVSKWPTQGILGGFLLSLGLLAWLAIALFFTLGVLPKLGQMLTQKVPGSLTVALFDNFFLTGFFLQLGSFFGALDLTIAAHFGFASSSEAKLWLGLCLLTLLLNTYGRWGLTPALQDSVKKWQEATDETSRQPVEAVLRRQVGWVKALNGIQILAILVVMGLVLSANVGSAAPEMKEPPAMGSPASLPSSGSKVIFRMPPHTLTPATSRPVMPTRTDFKTNAP